MEVFNTNARFKCGVIVTRQLVYPGTYLGFKNGASIYGFHHERNIVAVDDVKAFMEFYKIAKAEVHYTLSYEEAITKAQNLMNAA